MRPLGTSAAIRSGSKRQCTNATSRQRCNIIATRTRSSRSAPDIASCARGALTPWARGRTLAGQASRRPARQRRRGRRRLAPAVTSPVRPAGRARRHRASDASPTRRGSERHRLRLVKIPAAKPSSSTTGVNGDERMIRPFPFSRPTASATDPIADLTALGVTSRRDIIACKLRRSSSISASTPANTCVQLGASVVPATTPNQGQTGRRSGEMVAQVDRQQAMTLPIAAMAHVSVHRPTHTRPTPIQCGDARIGPQLDGPSASCSLRVTSERGLADRVVPSAPNAVVVTDALRHDPARLTPGGDIADEGLGMWRKVPIVEFPTSSAPEWPAAGIGRSGMSAECQRVRDPLDCRRMHRACCAVDVVVCGRPRESAHGGHDQVPTGGHVSAR